MLIYRERAHDGETCKNVGNKRAAFSEVSIFTTLDLEDIEEERKKICACVYDFMIL